MSDERTESVSVVIATRGRPELLRAAVRAVLQQDSSVPIELVVVFDQVDIDDLADVLVPDGRSLRTVSNTRTPGLAGGRNTGILESQAPLVAFCDDDDEWLPDKLRKQLALLAREPGASLAATGVRIQTTGAAYDRLPPARASFGDFLASRITEIHPSSFLIRRTDLEGAMGMIDEQLPASYGEDYDLLLRAARRGDVVSVVEPLVIVHWNRTSFFSERWQGIADGLTYLLSKYPEFKSNARGSARIEGQIAFAYAALAKRRVARVWAIRALRHDFRQLRAVAAILVSWGLVSPTMMVRLVNRSGRGL